MNKWDIGSLIFSILMILCGIALLISVINTPSENISCKNLSLLTNQQIQPIGGKDGCEILVADKYWIPFDQWIEEMQ